MVEQSETVLDDEKARSLYVRLPKVIKDDKEVMSLFPDNVKVKLPRQTSRCCHVVFPTVEERIKCTKKMSNKMIDGKKIVLIPVTEKSLDKRNERIQKSKDALKKIILPIPEKDSLVHSLYVTKIANEASISEIKEAFPGCVSASFLPGRPMRLRAAVVKMERMSLATAYLTKEIPAPKIKDTTVIIHRYKKKSKAQRKKKKNSLKKEKSDKSDTSDSENKDDTEEETEG